MAHIRGETVIARAFAEIIDAEFREGAGLADAELDRSLEAPEESQLEGMLHVVGALIAAGAVEIVLRPEFVAQLSRRLRDDWPSLFAADVGEPVRELAKPKLWHRLFLGRAADLEAQQSPGQVIRARSPALEPRPKYEVALVEQAQGGDVESFLGLLDMYLGTVFRYIYYRVSTRALAEDLTSETFVRALRRITTFSWQGRDFGAWLVTIARNLVADYFKSSRHRMEVSTGEMLDSNEVEASPEDLVLESLSNAALLDAVHRLNDQQRECVTLRFVQGLSVAETADIMGKNEGAIKTLQYRAVRTLARLVPDAAENGSAPGAEALPESGGTPAARNIGLADNSNDRGPTVMEVQVTIQSDDPVEQLNELSDWLRREPELRGLIRPVAASAATTTGMLGAIAGTLAIPIVASGVVAVLAAALKGYLARPRRSEVRIEISAPDGRTVRLDAARLGDVEALVSQLAAEPGEHVQLNLSGDGNSVYAVQSGDILLHSPDRSADGSWRDPEPLIDIPDKVLVYLDTHDPETTAAVQLALRQLFDSEGLELDLSFGPVISSWLAHFKIRSKRALSSTEVVSRIQKVEKAFEAVVLDKPMAAVNVDQAEAASKLLKSLEGVDNAVMAIGSLILVKITTPGGASSVYVKTLTVAELRAFEAHQHLMSSPQEALEHLYLLAEMGTGLASERSPVDAAAMSPAVQGPEAPGGFGQALPPA